MKKFLSLFLVFSLLLINCAYLNMAEEKRESRRKKHGANLIIQKINGHQVEGELITVKPNSLLLLNTEGKDVSVDIGDIKVIRIVKKSKALLGAGMGFLIGAAIGAAVGASLGAGWLEYGIEISAVIGGFALGILAGFIVSSEGKDKKIQIEGMTDSEIQEALDYLRKKARIRDYR